eukprot:SAG31_NODE_37464_length_304_cov_0.746341_1_plen_72_part_10
MDPSQTKRWAKALLAVVFANTCDDGLDAAAAGAIDINAYERLTATVLAASVHSSVGQHELAAKRWLGAARVP